MNGNSNESAEYSMRLKQFSLLKPSDEDKDAALKKKIARRIRKMLYTLKANYTEQTIGDDLSITTNPSFPKSNSSLFAPSSVLRSRTPKRQNKSQYLASMATVQRILKFHKERKYHAEVPTASQLVLLDPTPKPLPKEEEIATEYYTIDKSNKTPKDYFTINNDVAAFARNYDQIRKILQHTASTKNDSIRDIKKSEGDTPKRLQIERSRSVMQGRVKDDNKLPQITNSNKKKFCFPGREIIKLIKIKPKDSKKKLVVDVSKRKYENFLRSLRKGDIKGQLDNLTRNVDSQYTSLKEMLTRKGRKSVLVKTTAGLNKKEKKVRFAEEKLEN